MIPTNEQMEILKVAKNMKKGDILLVNALAGCAKTTTLKMITEDNQSSKFLYLAFNKAIVEESKNKFPENTKLSTFHGFAKGYIGRKNTRLLNLDLISEITKKDIENKNEFFKIFNLKKVYERFCNSHLSINELDILKDEIREEMFEDFNKKANVKNMDWLIQQRLKEVDKIELIHKSILSSDFTTFDTDLKEFVETAENITFKYDYIVLDEAQDISKLLAKFILSIANSKKYKIIVVGDNNQKIYGFLGNINLSKILEDIYKNRVIRRDLTQTFRFMPNSKMEELSNKILNIRKEKIFGARENLSDGNRNAYISRATFPLLAMAIYQIHNKKDYFLFGGIGNFNVEEIKDIYNLFIHMKIIRDLIPNFRDSKIDEKIELLKKNRDLSPFPNVKTKSLQSFSSFLELEHFVKSRGIMDFENNINIAIFIFSKRGELDLIESDLPNLVDKFFHLIDTHNNENSSTIISTIHKTKGLEFENVTILRSLNLFFDEKNSRWITHEAQNGYIIGLDKVFIKNESQTSSLNNKELSTIFKKYGGNDKNFSEENREQEDFNLQQFENLKNSVVYEQIINRKNSNIREEYNILYVGITRAINSVKISNVHYLETLEFLTFVNDNLDQLIKVIKGENSELLDEIRVSRNGSIQNIQGIIYKDSFISKETLKEILDQI
jgi:superfamily I DNA/RNA helicase